MNAVPEDDLPDSLRGKAVPEDDLPDAPKPKHPENEARRTGIKPVKELRSQSRLAPVDWEKAKERFAGLGQFVSKVAGGAVAEPVAGLVGLGAAALPGKEGQGARAVDWMREHTTGKIPLNPAGQELAEGVAKPFEMAKSAMGQGGRYLAQSQGMGPEGQAAMETAGEVWPDVASTVFGGKAALSSAKRAPVPPVTQTQDALLRLKDKGYVVPPSISNPSLPNQALTSVADPATLLETIRAKNAVVDTKLAKADIGLPESAFLNDTTLTKLREQHTPAYEAIRKVKDVDLSPDAKLVQALQGVDKLSQEFKAAYPNMGYNKRLEMVRRDLLNPAGPVTPGVVLDAVAEIRNTAKALFKKRDASPEDLKAAGAMRNVADELESFLDRKLTEEYWVGGEPSKVGTTGRELAKVGDKASAAPMSTLKRVDNSARKKLIKEWRDSRQALAKIHDVENVLNPQTGAIDSAALSRARKNGAPLSGNLATIADAYDAMEGLTSTGIKASDASRGRALVQAVKGMGLGAGAGAAVGGPVGAGVGAAAGIAAPAAARRLMASKLYQQAMTNPSPEILAQLRAIDPKAAAALAAAQAGRTNDTLPEPKK